MKDKKISIIVPVYNTEKHLKKCLDSIINQDYKNIEIVLINDGSTDDSLKICCDYKEKDSRIIVIDKKHTGVSDTRNIGIKAATGDYIGFVDSDDYLDRDMFKNLVNGIEKYNADISMCDLKETKSKNLSKINNNIKYIEMERKYALEQLLYDKNIGNYLFVKLFKKQLFKDIAFPVGKVYEDIATLYKLFCKANKIVYTPTVMYYYYQTEGSIVRNITRESIKDFIESIFQRYYYLKNNFEDLNLYNVYSLVNVVVRMSRWAIGINDEELFDNEIYDYYCKLEKELNLVDNGELIKLMSDFEIASLYLLKMDKEYLKNFLKKRIEMKNRKV